MLTKHLECGSYGWFAVVFDEESERVGHWYGSREECERIDPNAVELYPVSYGDRPDPFDLACERRHD